jgi:hypothetical protein
MRILLFLAICAFSGAVYAEEGMWTFNNFPKDKVKKAYGFEPTQDWLDHVRLSSACLAQGCSSSFISPNGLVMTNHHCAQGCISQLSTREQDLLTNGFYAKEQAQERKCPALEVNQLTGITDVTEKIKSATKGLTGEEFTKKRNATVAELEKACQTGEGVRCDVVSLYNGGVYNLYQYCRYQDVRLVWAPEFAIAFFGGDPDNFNFPRYDLDITLLRIYDNGQPVKTPHYFKWSEAGAKEGELTFVSGHPGSTQRLLTVAQLKQLRDETFPNRLFQMSEMRGMLTQYQLRGEEQKRFSNSALFGIENSMKAIKGEWEALVDETFFDSKVKDEAAFKAKVMANPKWRKEYGQLWNEQMAMMAKARPLTKESGALSMPMSGSRLFSDAVRLVRWGMESKKPDGERLPGYNDSQVPAIRQGLFSPAPISKEFEIERFTHALTKMREQLGPDHPSVKTILGRKSPRELATETINATRLEQAAERRRLFEGGMAAVDASTDPMIAFAKKFEPIQRELVVRIQKEIQPEGTRISEALAKARFDVYGTSIYPDATFSLRLSYGSVKGYQENGKEVRPFTILGGAFERHTGADPFALPKSWLEGKDKLDLTVPFNFVSTNDIIGGNSGSPVINQKAEIVGLVFDGNIQSLGGAFGFDETVNRTVSVSSRGILETMKKIYNVDRILEEIAAAQK